MATKKEAETLKIVGLLRGKEVDRWNAFCKKNPSARTAGGKLVKLLEIAEQKAHEPDK